MSLSSHTYVYLAPRILTKDISAPYQPDLPQSSLANLWLCTPKQVSSLLQPNTLGHLPQRSPLILSSSGTFTSITLHWVLSCYTDGPLTLSYMPQGVSAEMVVMRKKLSNFFSLTQVPGP